MGTTPETVSTNAMEDIAIGQRLLILAIVVNIVSIILSRSVDPLIGFVVALGGLVVAIIGMIRATSGLGFSSLRKVLYVIGLFIPLVSLILMAVVSSEATKVLRANGYKVGFFGAKRTTPS